MEMKGTIGEMQPPQTSSDDVNSKKRKATSEASTEGDSESATTTAESQAPQEGTTTQTSASGAQPDQPMSKKAMKRLKKAEEMKVKRKYQRAQRKERQKKLKEEAKANGPRVLAEGEEPPMSKWKQKKKLQRERVVLPQRVIIDCSFDSQMTDREVSSLVNQLSRCYSVNNNSSHCLQLHLTSFGGKTEQRLRNDLSGFQNWKNITVDSRGYMDVFRKEELVYLTAESPNVIHTLEDDKVYIIGGLVDHNRLKGITYKIAQEQGIATAQLPIGEYLKMASRKVLTVNHVFEILLKFKLSNDWEKTLLEVVPKRKGAQSKASASDDYDDDDHEDDDDDEEGDTAASAPQPADVSTSSVDPQPTAQEEAAVPADSASSAP